jgi:hypothetical protein
MQILITPENLIKRCLWSKYQKFVLKNLKKDEIINIIEENKIVNITENDAYVIGLLKTIETKNLIHRFKLYIEDFLKIKSTINDDKVIINKSSLLKEIIEFKDMFPETYKPDLEYQTAIDDMKKYVINLYEKIDKFDIIQRNMHDKLFTYVLSHDVQKLIKKLE